MKFSWLAILVAFIMPYTLIGQNSNNSTSVPNKKERIVGTSSKTLKKESLDKREAPILSPANLQTMQDRAKLKENQIKMQQAKKEREAIYQEYLGVSSNKDPLYAQRKQKLAADNPTRFKEFKTAIRNAYAQKRTKTIPRQHFNSLTIEQQREIKNNPAKYKIID